MTLVDDLIEAMEPWISDDLEGFLRAVASMTDEVELYAFDFDGADPEGEDDREGWTILLDVDRAPIEGLRYLMQFIGERLPTGLSLPAARQWLKDAPNLRRGTPESIARVAQRGLPEGARRRVVIRERRGGPEQSWDDVSVMSWNELQTTFASWDGILPDTADYVQVRTFTPETPDPEFVRQQIRRDAVPGDIVLDYGVIDAQDWNTLELVGTWDDVVAKYATWDEVVNDLTGYEVWT